jgi:putative Ca2+/H+ antiporter (TMEM165/GDT1 family)
MTGVILMIAYFFAAYVGALFTKDVDNSKLEMVAGVYFIIIG